MAKPLRDLHDVELAALSAAGGRREFGELVRRHSAAVRGLLRRMGAQPALADDVAQDAFLLAFEKCAEFRGEGTFGAWIKRIAARLYLKRRSKDARYVDEAENQNIDPTDAMAEGLRQLGVNTYDTSSVRIEHRENRMRFLWAKHGGFDLVAAAGVSIED